MNLPLLTLATATLSAWLRSPPRVDPNDDDGGNEEDNTYGLPKGRPIKKNLIKWFRKQKKQVLGTIETLGVPLSFPSLGDFDHPMGQAMTPILGAYWDEAGQKTMERLGLDPEDWRVTNPHLHQQIQTAAFQFCRETNQTTTMQLNHALAKLREEMTAGLVTEGESVAELTKRVKTVFRGAETWRARRIAQTEASRAVHAAQLEADKQSGVVAGLEWLISADACPLCQQVAAEAKRVQLGQAFAVVGDNPDYSTVRHPPLHPHCACAVTEVLKPEYGGPENPDWAAPVEQPGGDGYGPEGSKTANVPEPEPEKLGQPERRPGAPVLPGRPLLERLDGYEAGDAKLDEILAIARKTEALEAELADNIRDLEAWWQQQIDAGVHEHPDIEAELRDRTDDIQGIREDLRQRRAKSNGKAWDAIATKTRAAWTMDAKNLDEPGQRSATLGLSWLNRLLTPRDEAEKTIKTDWALIPAHLAQRGFYFEGRIHLPANENIQTAVHELGHMMEHSLAGALEAEQQFWRHRVGQASPVKLREIAPASGYGEDEEGYEDGWRRFFGDRARSAYAGKIYGTPEHYQGGEVLSMGLEALYRDPIKFAQADPEWCKFILGILDGSLR